MEKFVNIPDHVSPQPLGAHFTAHDVVRSPTAARQGIKGQFRQKNYAPVHNKALEVTAYVLDPLVAQFGKEAFHINSWYRSYWLNLAIGGSRTSAHSYAAAVDLDSRDNRLNRSIFEYVLTNPEVFEHVDQLIWEFGGNPAVKDSNPMWVHVGIAKPGNKPRNQVLQAYKNKWGRTRYSHIKGSFRPQVDYSKPVDRSLIGYAHEGTLGDPYITVTGEVVVENLNLRQTPSANSELVKKGFLLKRGDKVEVLESKSPWLKVKTTPKD